MVAVKTNSCLPRKQANNNNNNNNNNARPQKIGFIISLTKYLPHYKILYVISNPITKTPWPQTPWRIKKRAIQYGYIIEAAILYYPIRNGWKLWYGINGLFYYKSIQDWRSYDLQNLGLKIHNFSLELKQSKTPPAASCWIISTLVRRYVFFNPRCCKSWDCPNTLWLITLVFLIQILVKALVLVAF